MTDVRDILLANLMDQVVTAQKASLDVQIGLAKAIVSIAAKSDMVEFPEMDGVLEALGALKAHNRFLEIQVSALRRTSDG